MHYDYAKRMANLNGSATREIFKLLSNPETAALLKALAKNI